MNKRFIVLSVAASVIRVLGGFLALGGLIAVVAGDGPYRLAGAAVVTMGVLSVAFAELIGVAFAIEDNTRRAADAAGGVGK